MIKSIGFHLHSILPSFLRILKWAEASIQIHDTLNHLFMVLTYLQEMVTPTSNHHHNMDTIRSISIKIITLVMSTI